MSVIQGDRQTQKRVKINERGTKHDKLEGCGA